MYKVGDKIVYPMYGAGIVDKIEEREILGNVRRYYIMKISTGTMDVMVPVENSNEIGIRYASDCETASKIIENFDLIPLDENINWNKRYRENMQKLKNGDIIEVAKVVKSLSAIEKKKGLSTGERKMLVSAKNILVSEIMISLGASKEEVEEELEKLL